MQYEILTGLSHGQLAGLAARITGRLRRLRAAVRNSPAVTGLFRSVAMVAGIPIAIGSEAGNRQYQRWDALAAVTRRMVWLVANPHPASGRRTP